MKVKVKINHAHVDFGIDKRLSKLLFPRGFFTLLVEKLIEKHIEEIEKESHDKLELLERLYISVYGSKENWSGSVWETFKSAKLILTQLGEIKLSESSKDSLATVEQKSEKESEKEVEEIVEAKGEVQELEEQKEEQEQLQEREVHEVQEQRRVKVQEQKLVEKHSKSETLEPKGESFEVEKPASEGAPKQQRKKIDTKKVEEFFKELEQKFVPRKKEER